MKMKIIALFLLTFVVAATAKDFFKKFGPFQDKLDAYGLFFCVADCEDYVANASCGSICEPNGVNFNILMTTAWGRAREPICGVTLGSIPYGQVMIPLETQNKDTKCSWEGNLTVSIIRDNTRPYELYKGLHFLLYINKAMWNVDFKGLNLSCSKSCSAANQTAGKKGNMATCVPTPLQRVGRVDVKLDINFEEFITMLEPKNEDVFHRDRGSSVSAKYLDSNPTIVSKADIQKALTSTFATEQVVRGTLMEYFRNLSKTLFVNCITSTCPRCYK